MGRKRVKSELERSVDGLVWSDRVKAARRPEEWVRWGSAALLVVLVHYANTLVLIVVMAILGAVQVAFMKRRLGVRNASQMLARMVPELVAKTVRRDLRKGRYDAKVGPEARAVLERCAGLANATVEATVETHMMNGGGRAALEAFRPLTASAEASMRAALTRVNGATLMRRLPDEEALDDLRAVEAELAGLREEAKALARAYRPASTLREGSGLVAERAEARRELDQGV